MIHEKQIEIMLHEMTLISICIKIFNDNISIDNLHKLKKRYIYKITTK
jgi:hypothetical protein